ncbi:MAG: hypothetical protein JNK04_16140 [Myxococcales bacterium]|nr:hypothetical protein [Myxococcales bacterium]
MCNIGGPTGDDEAVAIGLATIRDCRSDLPAQVPTDRDTLVCDGNDAIQSNHLLVATAAQNYGQNSYRARQPFDFAGRTGTIVFDADGTNSGLLGWISLEVTEDPTPAPSFTFEQNYENGSIPRNGIEVQFAHLCGGENVGVSDIIVYDDFAQASVFSLGACAPAARGKLNHFEVRLSEQQIEVYATPPSDDGLTFGEPVLLGSADVALPFSRGYVHFTTHNHATVKYSVEGICNPQFGNDDCASYGAGFQCVPDGPFDSFCRQNGTGICTSTADCQPFGPDYTCDDRQTCVIDAWLTRWDNLGFDGPAVVGAFREYEALDSLTPTSSGKTNVAYRVADAGQGPAQTIQIDGVDIAGATSAKIALQNWALHDAGSPPPVDYALNYRMNGGAWKARTLTPSELQMMSDLPNAGTRSIMLDIDVADLVAGTNEIEFTASNANQGYPPVVLNIDLILETP